MARELGNVLSVANVIIALISGFTPESTCLPVLTSRFVNEETLSAVGRVFERSPSANENEKTRDSRPGVECEAIKGSAERRSANQICEKSLSWNCSRTYPNVCPGQNQ